MEVEDEELLIARARSEEFPLISIQDVAKKYKKSLRTLRRWEAAGVMPPRVRHGRRLKYDKAAIAEMMATRQSRQS